MRQESFCAVILAVLAVSASTVDVMAAAVPPPGDIVSWWPGDGDGSNLAGAPGTPAGGVTFAPAMVGQAFQFSGSGQYVSTALDVQPSALPSTTWEAWVYPTRVNAGSRQQILSSDSGGYGRSLLIEMGTTNFGVFTGDGVWQPAGVSTNEWQHIAVVFAPTNVWFYKNGVQYSLGRAPTLRNSTATLNIGRNPGVSGEDFTGAIDEVTVYSRALSADEIQAIYAAGADGKSHAVSELSDLAVVQHLTPEPVSIGVGQRLTNTVVVSNLGPGTARTVTLAVTIPADTTFVSAISSAGTCYRSGSTVYCVAGDLTNAQAATVQIILTPVSLGTRTNIATVSSLATDPVSSNNTITTLSHVYGYYTATDGDWSAKQATLENTPEAGLMVRVGDIDNLGFGWPSSFDPFSGNSTPQHTFPWTVDSADPAGTDRIMVVSSYAGSPPHGADGYTSTTSRPANSVQPITLTYDLGQRTVSSAALQIFVDDFQTPVWGTAYEVTLNGVRAPFLESVVNSLVQTGPIGKLITVALPSDYLYLVQSGGLVLRFDDSTTGAGDGYAIDFVKLLVNIGNFTQRGTIQGTVKDGTTLQPLAGVQVSAQGISSTTTDANGQYTLTNVVAGLVTVTATFPDYSTQIQSTDLIGGQTNQVDFTLTAQPILRIEALSAAHVRVSWPGALTGFALQTTTPLVPADWVAEGTTPGLYNGRHAVTNSVGSTPRLYRLVK